MLFLGKNLEGAQSRLASRVIDQQIVIVTGFSILDEPCTINFQLSVVIVVGEGWRQCDQKKIARCLLKLPKNDFTRKVIDFDTFTKIAKECGRFGQINCCPKSNKLPNLVTIYHFWRTFTKV